MSGITLVPITVEPIRLPLASDPGMQEANTGEALAAYIQTGDPYGLDVPPGTLHIIVTPPTLYDRAEAEQAAGVAPVAGLAPSSVPDAEQTPEQQRAAAAWAGWWRRVQLHLIDRCIRIEGAPPGMATTTVVESIHHDTDPGETPGLRLRVLAELIARITLTSRLHQAPKAR